MGFFSRHIVWDSMGLQLCQHRSWTGALEEALTGLSVVSQSLDPDKTSEFIPQFCPWAITHYILKLLLCLFYNCCAKTTDATHQVGKVAYRWLLQPTPFFWAFHGKVRQKLLFPDVWILSHLAIILRLLHHLLRKLFACFDSSFSLLVTLIALRGYTAALKSFLSGA